MNAAFQGGLRGGSRLCSAPSSIASAPRSATRVSIAAWSLAALGHAAVGERGRFLRRADRARPRRRRKLSVRHQSRGAVVPAQGARVRDGACSTRAPTSAPSSRPRSSPGWPSRGVGAAAFVVAGRRRVRVARSCGCRFTTCPSGSRASARRARAHPQRRRSERATSREGRWRTILGYRQAWAFIVAKFLTDRCGGSSSSGCRTTSRRRAALDIKNSWVHLVAIYTIVTVLSIAGGWITG